MQGHNRRAAQGSSEEANLSTRSRARSRCFRPILRPSRSLSDVEAVVTSDRYALRRASQSFGRARRYWASWTRKMTSESVALALVASSAREAVDARPLLELVVGG